MNWSPQQNAALKAVSEWLANPNGQQIFRLFGYAGTGKTTLARELAADVGGIVYFSAYTGKAAHVLGQKGCPGARTLHSLIYQPIGKSQERLKRLRASLACKENPGGLDQDPYPTMSLLEVKRALEAEKKSHARPSFILNPESDLNEASLLVIDECSMVDAAMAADVLSFQVPVLVLGDPAQLPPVGGGGYFTNAKPDHMLTEIHRQADGDPIIHLATMVRQGERLVPGTYGESRVITKAEPQDAINAEQIIVGKNTTRRACNRRKRELLGRTSPLPEAQDRVICLRNNRKQGLLNGSIWNVQSSTAVDEKLLMLDLTPEDGEDLLSVVAHEGSFLGEDLTSSMTTWERLDAEEFDFGYAITGHKSQGSQWDDVLIFDESRVFRGSEKRWLYTSLTRAAKKVTVVV